MRVVLLLHFTAWLGYIEIINDLIKNGENINAANEHRNIPLHYAAQNGYEDVVALLLEKGANINAVVSLGLFYIVLSPVVVQRR